MSDIIDRIKYLVMEHLDVEESKVTLDSCLSTELGADSLDSVELIMALEEEFEIEITDEEAHQFMTVQNIIDFINKKITKKNNL